MSDLELTHPRRILVTGSSGLIGRALTTSLRHLGHETIGLDIRGVGEDHGDVRSLADVRKAAADCDGIVHLAAVSRVIDGERDPATCWTTNVDGTRNVLQAAERSPRSPWVIYGSSREVYGQPDQLPTTEQAPRLPVNIYGRSKVAAEDLCDASPVRTAVLRFSNVYGSTVDHADRVIPAFTRQAATGERLRVDGRDHTFDFTHLDDTVRGILAVIRELEAGHELPAIHFVTGTPTTLGQLADLAIELAGTGSTAVEAPPRDFDVARFCGDPGRAAELLGWTPQVALRDGLAQLIAAFRAQLHDTEVA